MHVTGFMNNLPLWLIFPGTLILALIFWEFGYRFGHRTTKEQKPETEQSITTLVSIIVGLVAFLLAFTFNMAAGRFQERRDVFLEDVNAIGTTYLRADLVAEPERSKLKSQMREYVDLRISIAGSDNIQTRLDRTTEIQDELWKETVAVTEKDRSPVAAVFVTSLNEMLDMHTKRMTIMFQHRIPDSVWLALYALTIFGIAAMGYQNGLLDHGRSPAVLIVALMFAVVISMIADLDTPGQGTIYVDQQPIIELRNSMK